MVMRRFSKVLCSCAFVSSVGRVGLELVSRRAFVVLAGRGEVSAPFAGLNEVGA